jgi:cytosine/uracil/thiamine/allantoin permease
LGWFALFKAWANDNQSLLGCTLVTSLFVSFGASGWSAFAALIAASLFVMDMVNLSGAAGERYGSAYPVFARASMGTAGAKLPAVLRAVVAVFWQGAQVYFASAALAILSKSLTGAEAGDVLFLGLSGIDWVAFLVVWVLHILIFWRGMNWVGGSLNLAGPFVYAVMIALVIVLWSKSDGPLLSAAQNIFANPEGAWRTEMSGFVAIFDTMVAYFSAVMINFSDFSRFAKDKQAMVKGNLMGLPLNGVSNLPPDTTGFRKASLITSGFALVIGCLWTAVIRQIGIGGFVNTLGATLAPLFGMLMVDYFVVRKQVLSQKDLYNMDGGKYHYKNGWHDNAVIACAIGAVFSVATVWLPMLSDLSGCAWIIGAALGAAIYYARTKHMKLA